MEALLAAGRREGRHDQAQPCPSFGFVEPDRAIQLGPDVDDRVPARVGRRLNGSSKKASSDATSADGGLDEEPSHEGQRVLFHCERIRRQGRDLWGCVFLYYDVPNRQAVLVRYKSGERHGSGEERPRWSDEVRWPTVEPARLVGKAYEARKVLLAAGADPHKGHCLGPRSACRSDDCGEEPVGVSERVAAVADDTSRTGIDRSGRRPRARSKAQLDLES